MQATVSATRTSSDPAYSEFERLITNRVASLRGPLFTTNAEELFDAYLAGIPEENRQHYTCNCCRRFIERFGGLVTIGADGLTTTALWQMTSTPEFFLEAVNRLQQIVCRAKVTGVFINGDKTWGNPRTGEWTHLSGEPHEIHKSPLKNASQVAAEKLQDYITLKRGLEEFSLEAVVQAVRVLEADAVDRSEKTLGTAQWLLALHRSIADVRGTLRDNLVWLAVAKAPPGWCHIRSTMIGTLLENVIAGLPFDTIKARWDAKMHPLKYQRPTTVKEGNIEQANKIVAKLQSEGSLQRRFARLEEVTALWKPRAEAPQEKPKSGGPFDHLRERSSTVKPVELPAAKISWEKFRDTVLPMASEIEVHLPAGRAGFFGMVTAANADAPPILQWDGLEGFTRNPMSWYFYHGGSMPADWALLPGWQKVDAICLKPCHWQKEFTHQGEGVFFVLSAAKDMRHTTGAGFFPECLRAEYHEIRHAMEAYARGAAIVGRDEGTANGIALQNGQSLTFRVRSAGVSTDYFVTMG